MKLTQKVDYFTVFESFPSTSCCSQKFPPNETEKIGWLDLRGCVTDVYIGKVAGDGLKIIVQNCGRVLVKPKNQGCAGSLMAELKQNLHCGRLGC